MTEPAYTMREIAEAVARAHRLTLADLMAPTTVRRIAHPRQEAMAAMCATGRYSTTQAGRFFGKDHTTAMHAIRVVARRAEVDRLRWASLGRRAAA